MGRVGDPGEIAEAVLWLLSEQASFVAGANIRVAGGRPWRTCASRCPLSRKRS